MILYSSLRMNIASVQLKSRSFLAQAIDTRLILRLIRQTLLCGATGALAKPLVFLPGINHNNNSPSLSILSKNAYTLTHSNLRESHIHARLHRGEIISQCSGGRNDAGRKKERKKEKTPEAKVQCKSYSICCLFPW